ncbi:MAG: dTDP-4-dehydrorhamnose reductase [Chitinophagales bacterium]|nr:dTDP-4-dehydrorhamnose reductase [Chitinophagales bacterium]
MKVLVTGGNGQLGSELKDCLAFSKHQVVFADRQMLDLADPVSMSTFFSDNVFDVVINCGAYTAVDKAESDELAANNINAVAPGLIAKFCKISGAKLIHISTDFVFDGYASVPYKETDETLPLSVYGKSKLEGEKHVLQFDSDAVIIRTGWLYSSYGHNFLKTILRLCSERGQLSVVFDQIGTPTYAADLALVIKNIMESGEWIPGVYHYSNEGVASWYDFAFAINRIAGLHCKILPIETYQYPTPAKRPSYSVLNKAKIKSQFGIYIPNWQESAELCIRKIKYV